MKSILKYAGGFIREVDGDNVAELLNVGQAADTLGKDLVAAYNAHDDLVQALEDLRALLSLSNDDYIELETDWNSVSVLRFVDALLLRLSGNAPKSQYGVYQYEDPKRFYPEEGYKTVWIVAHRPDHADVLAAHLGLDPCGGFQEGLLEGITDYTRLVDCGADYILNAEGYCVVAGGA